MPEQTPKLGQILEGNEERDAVHIAVLPVVAGDYLTPGQHVGLGSFQRDGGAVATAWGTLIGIVDPFLKGNVMKGQKFYLFLYPGTITTLRHHWEHPNVISDYKPFVPAESKASVEWMTNLAEEYCVSYAWLMDKADGIARGVDDWITFPVDCHGEIDPEEFWKHYEVIRGRFVDPSVDKSENIFSCSC